MTEDAGSLNFPQSVTNGWDAVCALSAGQVDALFFQQYLQDGPTNPVTPLRQIIEGSSGNWILDFVLGPPQVNFATSVLSMFLLKGRLVNFDPLSLTICSIIPVQPAQSILSGTLGLSQLSGQVNQVGTVVADLAAGAYIPQISGVEPGSNLATQIGTAVQAFFSSNNVQYTLGTIVDSDVPACLAPTSFQFAIQTAGNGDGCLVLLIRTNGPGGTPGPLPSYPIPGGYTAALIVSNQVLFGQLFPDVLTQEFFKPFLAKFSGMTLGGLWFTTATCGVIVLPPLGEASGTNPYTSDDAANPSPVLLNLTGMTFAPGGSHLSVTWNYSWDQTWTYWEYDGGVVGYTQDIASANLTSNYTMESAPEVDPVTCAIRFQGLGVSLLEQPDDPWYQQWVGGVQPIPQQFTSMLQDAVQILLGDFPLPYVDAFALSNLLFPAKHAVSFTSADLNCDLRAMGAIVPPLVVAPGQISLQPGGSQQFSATCAGQSVTSVLWELKPNIGSISPGGLYTAPAAVTEPVVVVVSAINPNDASQAGSGMVVVYNPAASTALSMAPPEVFLTAGQTLAFGIANQSGEPVSVTCTLSPNEGSISPGENGQWIYTAPPTIDNPDTVMVTATSTQDPSQTGTATIELVVSQPVIVTAAQTSIAPGQTSACSATASQIGDYAWFVYPAGIGSIQAQDGDSSQAIYTAPDECSEFVSVTVIAYGVDSGQVGIGAAKISVNPL